MRSGSGKKPNKVRIITDHLPQQTYADICVGERIGEYRVDEIRVQQKPDRTDMFDYAIILRRGDNAVSVANTKFVMKGIPTFVSTGPGAKLALPDAVAWLACERNYAQELNS